MICINCNMKRERIMKLYKMQIVKFTEMLASNEPVPGGGGVSALVGALAASLGCMAGNITKEKKKFADSKDLIEMKVKRLDELRELLLDLIEQDAALFTPLQKAYSIPKENPTREKEIRKVSLEACIPPIQMIRFISEVIDILSVLYEHCSALLISDIGCGAFLAENALKCAAMNIFINTKNLTGEEPEGLNKEAEETLMKAGEKARTLGNQILSSLKGQ